MKRNTLENISLGHTEYRLESLMREYGNDVLRTAYLYVKDMQMAEDMFQEVFLKVYRSAAGFKGQSSIRTWILSITINTCKDYLKSAYHQHVVPMYDFLKENAASKDFVKDMEQKEQSCVVMQEIKRLPEHYKGVVICIYLNEMSIEETAKSLAISQGTVKSRLSRAKAKLKAALEGRL